ncbi:MAG TPA: glycosyl hydrolase family 79 C-terminal domain-containing protein [Solirubrobacteraceae bacterium]|nr:glycosyl hydrolase family 79 C-terminal domain-containing protein [Solirubrobacteraceae bacterium]
MSTTGSLRRPLTRATLALVTLAVLAVVMMVAGCGTGGAQASTTTANSAAGASTQASTRAARRAAHTPGPAVGVSGAAVGRPVPPGFVGLSIEERALEQFAGSNPAAINPVFVHLIENIAPAGPVLRVAGDSTDWSWWPVAHMAPPGGVRYALTPTWMNVARALADDIHGRLILGVNLEADSRAVATAEAQAMLSRIGRSRIAGLELGNEPELYASFGWYRSRITGKQVPGRPPGYDFAGYLGDFSRFSSYLRGDPIAGPAIGGPGWLQSLATFINTEHGLRLVTVHAYPLKHCSRSTVITSAQLLANSSSHGLASYVAPWVGIAARRRLPLRIDEMNGISCGGTRGVSDTFTSALWLLDTLFEMARVGVSGVNVHTVPNTINEILGPELVGGHWGMRVHPEYYGMVMFAQAAPAGSRLLRVAAKVPAGVKVWATRSAGGAIHVVVINKRLAQAETVHVRIASAHGPATVEQLRAPSVHATSGVTLGGQTFGAATSTGQLAGTPDNVTVTPLNGTYSVRVPPASATMLSLPSS